MKGTIYVITNKINNKRYIGITTRNLEQRWYEHKRKSVLMKNEFKLYPAMNKYGIENFIIEGIDTADSLNELNEKEIFYIKKYDTINSGYNILPGGINSKHTEESKNKIRQATLKLGSPFNVGKKRSKDIYLKRQKTCLAKYGTFNFVKKGVENKQYKPLNIILFEKYIWENKKLFQLINLLEFNESTLRHKWREHYNIHGFLALKRFIMQKVQTG